MLGTFFTPMMMEQLASHASWVGGDPLATCLRYSSTA